MPFLLAINNKRILIKTAFEFIGGIKGQSPNMLYSNWSILKFSITVGIIVLSNHDRVGEDAKYWAYWYFVTMVGRSFT